MGLFIFRFWPVIIPLILYVIWLQMVGNKAVKQGRPRPRFRDGPWYWMVIATLLTGVGCMGYIGVTETGEVKGHYTPAHMEDGKIVPGKVGGQIER